MDNNLNTITLLISYLEEGAFEYLHNNIENFRKVPFSSAERRKILALALEYRNNQNGLGVLLVNLALHNVDKALMDDVEIAFGNWNPDMCYAGLEYLDAVSTKQSVELYAKLAIQYRDKLNGLPFTHVKHNQELFNYLLPKIIKCLENDALKYDYYSAAFYMIEVATPDFIDALKDNLIADLIVVLNSLSKYRYQSNDKNLWDCTAYIKVRKLSGTLLDLAGRIGDENFVSPLRSFMRINDMSIRFYTAMSIMRLGGQVRRTDFISIAASPEMRNKLYNTLMELGLFHHYPLQYKTQEAFAESRMVEWIVQADEVGRVPNEISLEHVFLTEEDGLEYRWYLFKFSVNTEKFKKLGFMAGIAGPYLKTAEASIDGGELTFSCYEPWGSKSPEEHFEQIASAVSIVSRKP